VRPPINGAYSDTLAGRDRDTALALELSQHQHRAQLGVHLVERRLQLRKLMAHLEQTHRITAASREQLRAVPRMATAMSAVAPPRRARRSHCDRAQITRGRSRTLHITTILVHHNEYLLHHIIDLAGWDAEPMKQTSHEWRMPAEELLRRYMRW
jgi:hypothetical protein